MRTHFYCITLHTEANFMWVCVCMRVGCGDLVGCGVYVHCVVLFGLVVLKKTNKQTKTEKCFYQNVGVCGANIFFSVSWRLSMQISGNSHHYGHGAVFPNMVRLKRISFWKEWLVGLYKLAIFMMQSWSLPLTYLWIRCRGTFWKCWFRHIYKSFYSGSPYKLFWKEIHSML